MGPGEFFGLAVFLAAVFLNVFGLGLELVLIHAGCATITDMARSNAVLLCAIMIVQVGGMLGLLCHFCEGPL